MPCLDHTTYPIIINRSCVLLLKKRPALATRGLVRFLVRIIGDFYFRLAGFSQEQVRRRLSRGPHQDFGLRLDEGLSEI